MKRMLLCSLFFLTFSCGEKEIPSDKMPLDIAIEDRETFAEINDLRAYLDVEQLGENLDSGYVFMLELMDSPSPQFLHVGNDQLVCAFLNEQMMFGSTRVTNCAGWGYFYRYLRKGFKGGNYRMHVTISGEIKEKFAGDIFTGEPFLLESITKIPSCPISFEPKDINPSLENNFWRLQGFINENGEIYSYPTCEDPEIGVFFYDSLVSGTPIEDSEAKTFDIRTEVSTTPPQLFAVYSVVNFERIRISLAVNPGWMPPRPATSVTDNFSRLTVDIKNKYDSLNRILRVSNEIEFAITQNILELYNPETQIRARFFMK
jgi:hypothetical protein